jgi:hypothetical protein
VPTLANTIQSCFRVGQAAARTGPHPWGEEPGHHPLHRLRGPDAPLLQAAEGPAEERGGWEGVDCGWENPLDAERQQQYSPCEVSVRLCRVDNLESESLSELMVQSMAFTFYYFYIPIPRDSYVFLCISKFFPNNPNYILI